MKLYIVRHSYTQLNEEKKIQGRIDIPLSENGKKHAYEVFKHLDFDLDFIATSPLIRATETAKIIGSLIGYEKPYITLSEFVERDFGKLDYETVEKAVPYVSGEKHIEGYEKDEDLLKRAKIGLDLMYTHYSDQTILLVCHAHMMKAILKLSNKIDIHFSHTKIMHQEYFILNYDGRHLDILEHKML
jgi:broad specificity phosphatase PhoE